VTRSKKKNTKIVEIKGIPNRRGEDAYTLLNGNTGSRDE
jgi:hypothetical protein